MKKTKFQKKSSKFSTNILKDDCRLYLQKGFDTESAIKAIDLLQRFFKFNYPTQDTEKNAIFAAAIYIVSRSPSTFPNDMSIPQFSKIFNVKATSIEWFLKKIIKKLKIIKIHDLRNYPYFIDSKSVIAKVIESVTYKELTTTKIKDILGLDKYDKDTVASSVVDELMYRLKILPSVFKLSLYKLIYQLIEKKE